MEAPWLRTLKTTLYRFAPPLFYVARYLRTALKNRRERLIGQRIAPIREAFHVRHGAVVQHGPFAGVRYVTAAYGSPLLPKLIGSYEAEVHAAIATALDRQPTTLVDVGCDEGYYAVGLLHRCPGREMFAFDINPKALEACRALAELNGVADRLTLEGACDPDRLQAVLRPGTFVVCDCEGYELDLLDPARVPGLLQADVLVELHDDVRLDCELTPTVLDRFRATHQIALFDRSARRLEDYPCLEFLAPEDRQLAMHEDRMPTQQWALLLAER